MKVNINYKGHDIEIEQLSNGKWKIPEIVKKFEGSYGGFQPKPAVEVIIVVQKPMSEKRFVDQALNNGKGITWLDDCRIPYKNDNDKESSQPGGRITGGIQKFAKIGSPELDDIVKKCPEKGRFPANLLVSDDVLDDGKVHKVGDIKLHKQKQDPNVLYAPKNITSSHKGDSGGYSRFFSLDAWAEKNLPFLIVPKANKKEKNAGLDKLEYRSNDIRISLICKKCGGVWIGSAKCKCEKPDWVKPKIKNKHPTVKPIKLMSYLITMGSREGDIVLDPFMGSGSTGCAAVLLRRNFVGVEKEEDYIKIAESRIEYWSKKSDQEKLF